MKESDKSVYTVNCVFMCKLPRIKPATIRPLLIVISKFWDEKSHVTDRDRLIQDGQKGGQVGWNSFEAP